MTTKKSAARKARAGKWGGRRKNQTGRPREEREPLVSRSFSVTDRVLVILGQRARSAGCSVSKALRAIVEESAS